MTEEELKKIPPHIETKGFSFFYEGKPGIYERLKKLIFHIQTKKRTPPAINNVSLKIPQKKITAFIGPSGCGKTTLLRAMNRINDGLIPYRIEGEMHIMNDNIFAPNVDVSMLRCSVGMVFQKPNPMKKSIFDNIAFGPRLQGIRKKNELNQIVEESLIQAALWDEVKDRLKKSALGLSGGQQQRLCIARAIAVQPTILLMDEPTSALDPKATAKVENLLSQLWGNFTIIIVTHNMQQAARVSDCTAFLFEGKLVEFGLTQQIFSNPKEKATEDYITGRFS